MLAGLAAERLQTLDRDENWLERSRDMAKPFPRSIACRFTRVLREKGRGSNPLEPMSFARNAKLLQTVTNDPCLSADNSVGNLAASCAFKSCPQKFG